MTTVVYASFEQQEDADLGAKALVDAGFDRSSIATFYLSPPGREAVTSEPDKGESPGAEQADEDSASGTGVGTLIGAVAGVAATPLLGPLAIAGGAGIGAYVGSLYGALEGMKDGDAAVAHIHANHPGHEADARLHSGMRVAVAVADAAQRERARSVLQAHRGLDVVTGEGIIEDGALVSPERPPE